MPNIIFNYSDSLYNEDNNKMVIRVFHSFQSRSINIIMNYYPNDVFLQKFAF